MSLATLAPIPLNWLAAILILILAARPDSLQRSIRKVLTSWLGILGLFAVGLTIFVHQPIVGTSVFILLFECVLHARGLRMSRARSTTSPSLQSRWVPGERCRRA